MHPRIILEQYDLKPKRSLGQNFLSDDNILAQIADCGNLSRADTVLEIGPGLGSLTRHLSHCAGKIIAIELDNRLIPILETRLAGSDNVRIIEGDILLVDLASLLGADYKVVANVPYYITGAILRHLLSTVTKPSRITMTVQQEVATRLTSSPGKMSIMSVIAQYYGHVEHAFTIKAGSFWPRPEVDSSVINIILKGELPLDQSEEEDLFRVVKVGFSQKRKQLQKNLRSIIGSRPQIQNVLESAGIDGTRRAETLSVEEWITLYSVIKQC